MASKKSSKPKIKPAAGYLLLEPVEAETKTESGIYLPESASEKPQRGKVLAVGADLETEKGKVKPPAKKGDIVIYKKWGGNEVKVGVKEYLFAKFEDILAIVK
jgi:chaperonin GroES